jgi:hypothetical protein
MRSKPNIAASVLVACSALGLAAGCASKQQTVSVQPGGPGSAAPGSVSASPSSSPTRPAKPAAEQVPDSAVLSVVGQTVPGPGSTTARTAVLTDAAKIKEIAADINALPTLPHYTGKVHCPMEIVGTTLTLDFRDSAAGPVLAVVRLGPQPSSQCNGGVQVTVGGTTEPQLDDSAQPKLFTEIEQLAGLTAS